MLIDDVKELLANSPNSAALLGIGECNDLPDIIGALMASICGDRIGATVQETLSKEPDLLGMTLRDVHETARRNFEPGGSSATLLFSRGIHATIGHRIAHHYWEKGDTTFAMALKAVFGRAFSTDIHPAAKIGSGFWLDHGLGFVAGETVVIGDDVSIWHNVTLGSTFNDSGATRHPTIERGAIIGAAASVLGGITVGAFSNIAAGAIVLENVPPKTTFVGVKARNIGIARVSFLDESTDS